MNHRIIRVTKNDYREYRRTLSNVEFSYFERGKEVPFLKSEVKEATTKAIKGKGEFLNEVENPNRELYFLEIDGEIQGFFELIFETGYCNIYEFFVLEHYKGWGSLLYQEALKIIKAHNVQKIILYCPFEGAKAFWRKKGFISVDFFLFQKNI